METIGVVLAGGASSRMGQDKALLSLGQTSMLNRTRKLLETLPLSKVVISRNDGCTDHIADLYPGKGPLSGIHSAAIRFPKSNLLVVPVDLPLLNRETLAELLRKANYADMNTRFGEHSLPLFLRNSESLRQSLDYTLKCTNSFSVYRFCSHFPIQKLTSGKAPTLLNTNTPEQWSMAMHSLNQSFTPGYVR